MTDINMIETDRLLTTTKQVRRRLDLDREVPTALLLECIDIANQAPMGGNLEMNRWLIVTDPEIKTKLGELYASVGRPYLDSTSEATEGRTRRIKESTRFLVENMHRAPAIILPLRVGRAPGADEGLVWAANYWGSVLPGVWSFQLAARARGLGSCWTTFHLPHDAAVAELLGIPADVGQVALLPVAFYTGESFRPAPRQDVHKITYLNGWEQPVD